MKLSLLSDLVWPDDIDNPFVLTFIKTVDVIIPVKSSQAFFFWQLIYYSPLIKEVRVFLNHKASFLDLFYVENRNSDFMIIVELNNESSYEKKQRQSMYFCRYRRKNRF